MDLTMPLPELVAGSVDGQTAVLRAIERMTDQQYAEPSRLPGWSRAHVVAHLVGNTLAQTRQVEYARDGQQIEVYTGGQQARDADIERRSGLPAQMLTDELRDAHQAWAAAVEPVYDRLAAEPVAYRDGTVTDVIAGRWMESLVHGVDLGLPWFGTQSWTPQFCAVLLDYLLVRLPADQQVRLKATDADLDLTLGNGPAVHLRGRLVDLTASLADRGPVDVLDSLAEPIGQLGPYPRGSLPR